MMTDHPPGKPSDLDKARLIVGRHGLVLGPAGPTSEHIAKAVAEGIALGREEGLALAAETLAKLKHASD